MSVVTALGDDFLPIFTLPLLILELLLALAAIVVVLFGRAVGEVRVEIFVRVTSRVLSEGCLMMLLIDVVLLLVPLRVVV